MGTDECYHVTKCGFVMLYFPKYRYLFELKEDDDACRKAHQTGVFYLFHNLAPLLQQSEHQYLSPQYRLFGKPRVHHNL